MAHFYNCKDLLNPQFEESVGTPHQAKKAGTKVYPSVTTVLGIVKDDFIDSIYKPKMITSLAREYPNLDWRNIADLTFGTREHPITGDTISSSEFGTSVHHCIEGLVNHRYLGAEETVRTDWDDWAMPFLQWIDEEGVSPIACESIISNNRIKIAGSIDFLGHDSEGTLFLADYKCRSNTKGKAKTYAKDCEQLAIESYMIMKQHKLDYLPPCRSVIIDCDTKQHIHREWSESEMKWGIANAKLAAKIYWNKRMKPIVK
jgi:hypothetical protein